MRLLALPMRIIYYYSLLSVPRILGISNTRYLEYSVSRILGISNTRYLEYSVSRILGISNTRYLEYSVPRILGISNTRYLEYSVSRILGISNTRYLEYSASRILGISNTRYLEYSVSRILGISNTRYLEYSVPRILGISNTRYLEYSVSRILGISNTRYLEQISRPLGHLLFILGKQLLGISNLVISNFSLPRTDFKAPWMISSRHHEFFEKESELQWVKTRNCSCLFMEGNFSNIFVCRGCFSSVVFSMLSPVLFTMHAIFCIVAFIVKALYLSVQAYCIIST